jgi:hypothetical protein
MCIMPTIDITDVSVVGLNDQFLGGEGTGTLDTDADNHLTRITCGDFALASLPKAGTDYNVSWSQPSGSGTIPQKRTLRCNVAAAPLSSFVPPTA